MSKVPSELKTIGAGFLYQALLKSPTEQITRNLSQSVGINLADNALRILGSIAGRRLIGNNMPFVKRAFDVGLSIEGAEFGKSGFAGLTNIFSGIGGTAQQKTEDSSNGAITF